MSCSPDATTFSRDSRLWNRHLLDGRGMHPGGKATVFEHPVTV